MEPPSEQVCRDPTEGRRWYPDKLIADIERRLSLAHLAQVSCQPEQGGGPNRRVRGKGKIPATGNRRLIILVTEFELLRLSEQPIRRFAPFRQLGVVKKTAGSFHIDFVRMKHNAQGVLFEAPSPRIGKTRLGGRQCLLEDHHSPVGGPLPLLREPLPFERLVLFEHAEAKHNQRGRRGEHHQQKQDHEVAGTTQPEPEARSRHSVPYLARFRRESV